MKDPNGASLFFKETLSKIHEKDFSDWLEELRNPPQSSLTKQDFMKAYASAVFASGMSYEWAEKSMRALDAATGEWDPVHIDRNRSAFVKSALRVVNHKGKIHAIADTAKRIASLDDTLSEIDLENPKKLLDWLDSLPWIGDANARYIAILLGLRELAKPDRHLLRVANRFGYHDDVETHCRDIASMTGEYPATVDFVFWYGSRNRTSG